MSKVKFFQIPGSRGTGFSRVHHEPYRMIMSHWAMARVSKANSRYFTMQLNLAETYQAFMAARGRIAEASWKEVSS